MLNTALWSYSSWDCTKAESLSAGHPLQPVGGVVEVEGRSQLLFLIFIICLLQILAACRLLVMVRRFSCPVARKASLTKRLNPRPPALEGGLQHLGHREVPESWLLRREGMPPIPMTSHWKETILKIKRDSELWSALVNFFPWKTLNPQYLKKKVTYRGNRAPNPVWLESLQQEKFPTQIRPQRHPVEMKAEV